MHTSVMKAFTRAMRALATSYSEFNQDIAAAGVTETSWNLLISERIWTQKDGHAAISALMALYERAHTIAGIQKEALPGQFVAAIIAQLVSPGNWYTAVRLVPDTWDAIAAAGVNGPPEIKPMEKTQILSLVALYAGEWEGEPDEHMLPSMELPKQTKPKK